MFEEKLDEMYSDLASAVIEMIPTDWKKIYYLGEVEKDKASWGSIFYFIDENDELVRSLSIPKKYDVSGEIYNELEEESQEIMLNIYDYFSSNEQELWNQILFSLNSEGEFEVEFKYDDNAEGYGPAMRETIWAYETFNYIPEKGFLKEFLEKYINSKGEMDT